jgi:hypothetical protein
MNPEGIATPILQPIERINGAIVHREIIRIPIGDSTAMIEDNQNQSGQQSQRPGQKPGQGGYCRAAAMLA